MTEKQYRRRWMRLHKRYEKKAYKRLMIAFREMGNATPYSKMLPLTYEFMLDANITEEPLYRAFLDIYTLIGVSHGNLIGKDINKETKSFDSAVFEAEYNRTLVTWLTENIGWRITSVRAEFIEFIQQLIINGYNEGKSSSEIAREIERLVNSRNFYRWQALRIARTETTGAANHAAMVSAESSNLLLDKIWISATDTRTRRKPKNKFDHLVMNGQKVDKLEAFNIQGEKLLYPGAPITTDRSPSSAGNVINCRCTVGFVAKRDRHGNRIRRE